MALAWIFQQQGGAQKRIVLSDYAAPFGRPRQKAIFEEKIEDRIRSRHMPGNSGPPVRHLLGTKWADEGLVLNGRWMDGKLNGRTARDLVESFQNFIQDEQRCTLQWGNLASYTGWVESVSAKWESPEECAWEIRFLIDDRLSLGARKAPPQPRPSDWLNLIDGQFQVCNLEKVQIQKDIKPDLLDSIDTLFSKIAAATSQLRNIANQLNDIEGRTFSTLQRLRLAIHTAKTAYLMYLETIQQAQIDASMFTRQANNDVKWFSFRNNSEVALWTSLDLLNRLDRTARLQQRGLPYRSYVARDGDTWESIAQAFYFDIERANDIRQANGVKGGALPTAGRSYRIPQ